MNTDTHGKKFGFVIAVLMTVLFLAIIFSICLGKYTVSPSETLSIIGKEVFKAEQNADPSTVNVILLLRLPRVLLAVLVGAALSVSGACYQSIFQNPLVSPDFLGVSSGACIGAAAAILLGLSSAFISGFAFIGGICAVLLTAFIPLLLRNKTNTILVLSGIIVGSLMSSVLGFMKYLADPDTQLASITYWTMGSFSYASAENILPACVVLILPMLILLLMSWWMDVFSMGADEAKAFGANVRLIRVIVIICSTLLTAGSVSFAGTIGWVGLIVPHFSRMLVGSSGRRVLPVSCITGGVFMLIVDTATRIIGVYEMPISIMTGIIGAPFFIWLLVRRRNEVRL